jgi:uncharacterized protein YegJ (DUF2314 family)
MKLIALLAVALLTFGALPSPAQAQDPETLVRSGYSQTKMDTAIARARTELGAFLETLAKGDADSYSVKAPITDKNGTEHFWLVDISYDAGSASFSGTVGNRPGIVRNVKAGQKWTIKGSEISDWMIMRGDKIHGGYTIDPLLSAMPKEQASAMRARLVR